MFTRAELEFKSRACLAQMKLRIVAFSIALVVPAWLGFWVLQKLKLPVDLGIVMRSAGVALLIAYFVGVTRILRKTRREHGLICPQCGASLGTELQNITLEGACKKCGERLIQ